jgi:5'-3' exonuclease
MMEMEKLFERLVAIFDANRKAQRQDMAAEREAQREEMAAERRVIEARTEIIIARMKAICIIILSRKVN